MHTDRYIYIYIYIHTHTTTYDIYTIIKYLPRGRSRSSEGRGQSNVFPRRGWFGLLSWGGWMGCLGWIALANRFKCIYTWWNRMKKGEKILLMVCYLNVTTPKWSFLFRLNCLSVCVCLFNFFSFFFFAFFLFCFVLTRGAFENKKKGEGGLDSQPSWGNSCKRLKGTREIKTSLSLSPSASA